MKKKATITKKAASVISKGAMLLGMTGKPSKSVGTACETKKANSSRTEKKADTCSCSCGCEKTQEEINLKRISESTMLCAFVQENMGKWDHAKWQGLCDRISKLGFAPVDFDQVGLLLEKCKEKYQSKLQ